MAQSVVLHSYLLASSVLHQPPSFPEGNPFGLIPPSFPSFPSVEPFLSLNQLFPLLLNFPIWLWLVFTVSLTLIFHPPISVCPSSSFLPPLLPEPFQGGGLHVPPSILSSPALARPVGRRCPTGFQLFPRDSFHTIEGLFSISKSLGRSANMTAETLTRQVLQETKCSDSDSATTEDMFHAYKMCH